MSSRKVIQRLILEGMLEDGQEIPTPTVNVEEFRNNPDYAEAIWALVTVDLDWRSPAAA